MEFPWVLSPPCRILSSVSPSVAGSVDGRIETPPGTMWYGAPASFPFRFVYRRAPAQKARDGSAEVSPGRRIPLRPLVQKSRRGVRRLTDTSALLARAFNRAPRDLRPTHRHENRDLRHPDGGRGEARFDFAHRPELVEGPPRPYRGFPPFGKLRAGFARE
jgi:hypothetical protein